MGSANSHLQEKSISRPKRRFDAEVEDPSHTTPRDFLKMCAQTPFFESFSSVGVLLSVVTNFEPLLGVAREFFGSFCEKTPRQEIRLRLWVDPSGHSGPPWPKPYFRGLDHLAYAGFDGQNSLLIDLRRHNAFGRFTPAMVADRAFWKKVIFPVLLSLLGSSLGLPELHCAGMAWEGRGLMLAGDSGSGKSTLSLALAQAGFDFLCDDRALFSLHEDRLMAWSLGPYLKLRPEAATYFPALNGVSPDEVLNGEPAMYLDPAEYFRLRRVSCCEPRWVFFLERQSDPAFNLAEISPSEAAARLEEGLPREAPAATKRQRETIEALAERDCWILRYGGNPHTVASALRRFTTELAENRKHRAAALRDPEARIEVSRSDPLRRFTPTLSGTDLCVMGRTVRLETNCPLLLKIARQAFSRYGQPSQRQPQFRWRIVSEVGGLLKPPWPEMTAFSDEGLRYINIGQRSYLAIDLEAREAVAFLSEELAKDEPGFNSVFLPTLYDMTSGALRLVEIAAACVALAGKGLLIFGPPRSGKTTATYLAGKLGLDFLSDQVTSLGLEGGDLRAWGQFWPAVFRSETLERLPELHSRTQPFRYSDLTLWALHSSALRVVESRGVKPVSCVFLEREAASSPRLTPLDHVEYLSRLKESHPYKDYEQFESQRVAVVHALGSLPAYRLAYGSDPATATTFFRSLLKAQHLLEAEE